MNTPLISVIVPIYMIDRYLGLCIESIINQTYKNLEIILVDDGSQDRCTEICDLYASKDKRIHVIHQSNKGLVSARKAGLQHSHGVFISYVDGDDWIESNFIANLYADAELYSADMVCSGFTKDLFSKSFIFKDEIESGKYEGGELQNLWKIMLSCGSYYKPGISTYVWNKLFKREILLSVQNRVDNRITLGEDAAVTYPALLRCKKIVLSENCDYHYRQREDSMLKQNANYIYDAQKLSYLYEYMMNWAKSTSEKLKIEQQVIDYILSIAIIRSGGRLLHDEFSIFDTSYYDKNVVIYSAGTFGQQLINRFKEARHCNVVGWVDDDYWEYRRCCLNVDSIQSISFLDFDYVLIATVNGSMAENIAEILIKLGVKREKILTIHISENKNQLLKRFLDLNALKMLDSKGVISHA